MSNGSSQYPVSGSQPFARLMEVLSKYVSVRTCFTLLNKSLAEQGLTPDSMVMSDLPDVVESMMPGLRVFCADHQVNDLVLDLSSLASVRTPSGMTRRPDSMPPPPISGTMTRRPSQFPPAGAVTEVTDALNSRRRR